MATLFNIDNLDDFSEKLNIDDLYEKKKNYDLTQLNLFNKLLNRVHIKIKTTSKQSINQQFCWFNVPEIILGVPKFDQGACIAYLMDKLKKSGFKVHYYHPNLLLISWVHWIPTYVRSEIKKKTGISINEYGEKIEELKLDEENNDEDYNEFNNINSRELKKSKKEYKSTKIYKPSGNLIYNENILTKIDNKFS